MVASRLSSLWDRLLAPPKRARPMGLIAVQMSINPFEAFMLAAVCIVGLLYLVGLPPPSSVRSLLGPAVVYVWAGNLGVGGLLTLFGGLSRRKLDRGLALYQFGWGLIGLGCLIYGIALLLLFQLKGLSPAMSNLAFAVAAFTRVIQVQRFFKLSEENIRRDARSGGAP